MNDLERQLGRAIEGEVRFDTYSRLLYSTDASMYQMEPIGVVIPRHAADVQAAIEIANARNVPVLPRGGGTSLTGQTVNRAVVLDFTPHMAQVLEVVHTPHIILVAADRSILRPCFAPSPFSSP